MKYARSALAVTILSVMMAAPWVGCGDDDGDQPAPPNPARDDGGVADASVPDAGADAPGAVVWPGICDPVRQDCPAGQQCTGGCDVAGVMAKVFTCAVPNPGASATHGQDCGLGCAPGHDCFIVDGDGGTRAVCRKYCNTSADCPNTACVEEGLICTAGDVTPIGRLCAL
jgi:hypothetical protein